MQGKDQTPQGEVEVQRTEHLANVGQQCFKNILLDIPKTLVGVPLTPGLVALRPVEHA